MAITANDTRRNSWCGSRLPNFSEVVEALEIVFFFDAAFDAKLREDGHHLA
jgi:hypothetical protein